MILVIDKSKSDAINISNLFYYLGILSNGATPKEALSVASPLYRAIVFNLPERHADIKDYISRLSRYAPGIPIFALSDLEKEDYKSLFSEVYPRGTLGSRLLEKIISYCDRFDLLMPGHYTVSGFDASFSSRTSSYFDDPLPFTKTENMILKALIRAYPEPLSPNKILYYSYRSEKKPEPSNIRTHLSIMNKKFFALTGRNLVFTSFGKGYSLLTPEEAERKAEAMV